MIFASEDVGNADPRALSVAVSVAEAVKLIGFPEARISLAQGVAYLATAPKSNASYSAIDEALADVREKGPLAIPMHIRNAPTKLMKEFGYGKGYEYAHSDKNAKVSHAHLPEELVGRRYYKPQRGYEEKIKQYWKKD